MTRLFSKKTVAITSIITPTDFNNKIPRNSLEFRGFFFDFFRKINIYKNYTKTVKSVAKYYCNYIFYCSKKTLFKCLKALKQREKRLFLYFQNLPYKNVVDICQKYYIIDL